MEYKIKEFVREQTIEYTANINGELKTVRRLANVDKYFDDNDTMTFTDDAETIFMKVNFSDNVLKIAENIDLKVYRSGQCIDLRKENFSMVRELISAIVGFFIFGSWEQK